MANRMDGSSTQVHYTPSVNKAEIEREIRAEEARWAAELEACDIDALVGHGSADGESNALTPGAAPASFEEQRRHWEKLFKDPNFRYPFTTNYFGIADSGELAYCKGDYETWGTDPKTQKAVILSQGSYINVWRKNEQGKWKTIEDFIVPITKPKS